MTDPNTPMREPSAHEVAAFLKRHPDFLNAFPDLAMGLKMPRQVGTTTSLASYQLDVLRDKNRALHRRLQELSATATRNEELVMRVHGLTLSLMRADSREATLERLVASLTEDFDSIEVRLVIYGPSAVAVQKPWLIPIAKGDPGLAPFADFHSGNEPLCGRLKADKLAFLFDGSSAAVESAALVAIGTRGLLAVGSADANRFYPGMGTLFLRLIAEALDSALSRFDGPPLA